MLEVRLKATREKKNNSRNKKNVLSILCRVQLVKIWHTYTTITRCNQCWTTSHRSHAGYFVFPASLLRKLLTAAILKAFDLTLKYRICLLIVTTSDCYEYGDGWMRIKASWIGWNSQIEKQHREEDIYDNKVNKNESWSPNYQYRFCLD